MISKPYHQSKRPVFTCVTDDDVEEEMEEDVEIEELMHMDTSDHEDEQEDESEEYCDTDDQAEDELAFVKEMEELVAELSSNDDCSEIERSSKSADVYSYKVVGDNIDKNFSRSHQRIERQTRSFHYFHSYAVLD